MGCRWLERVACDARVVSCRLVEVGFVCFGFVWWDCGLFCVLVLVLCVVCKLGGCVWCDCLLLVWFVILVCGVC